MNFKYLASNCCCCCCFFCCCHLQIQKLKLETIWLKCANLYFVYMLLLRLVSILGFKFSTISSIEKHTSTTLSLSLYWCCCKAAISLYNLLKSILKVDFFQAYTSMYEMGAIRWNNVYAWVCVTHHVTALQLNRYSTKKYLNKNETKIEKRCFAVFGFYENCRHRQHSETTHSFQLVRQPIKLNYNYVFH